MPINRFPQTPDEVRSLSVTELTRTLEELGDGAAGDGIIQEQQWRLFIHAGVVIELKLCRSGE